MNKDSKHCTRCNVTKPLSQFSYSWQTKDKHCYKCKDCAKERSADWKKRFPDRYAQYKANERKKRTIDPIPTMLISAKSRAKKKGWIFNLKREDIKMPILCPIFGITLKTGLGKLVPESPSLDRINSSLGYVSGNVRIISHRANTIKSNATAQELFLVADDLRRIVSQ